MTTTLSTASAADLIETLATVSAITTLRGSTTNTDKETFIAGLSTSDAIAKAMALNETYFQLQSARRLAFSSLTTASATIFDSLISGLATVYTSFKTYMNSGNATDLSSLKTALGNISTSALNTLLSGATGIWDIQDRVFFEYSKTGEASLNNELGQLGDALDTLAHVLQVANKLDRALSIEPKDSTGTTLLNADSTLIEDFATNGTASLMVTIDSFSCVASSTTVSQTSHTLTIGDNSLAAGDCVLFMSSGTAPSGLTKGARYYVIEPTTEGKIMLSNQKDGSRANGTYISLASSEVGSGTITLVRQQNAMVYTYNALQQLKTLQSAFDSSSTIYGAIADVRTSLAQYSVDSTTWSAAANPSSASNATWTSYFQPFWEDSTLRTNLNNLQTDLSSQNDIEKQTLRKALFIYQEFVKSAGMIMDRVYDAVKGIASRISR